MAGTARPGNSAGERLRNLLVPDRVLISAAHTNSCENEVIASSCRGNSADGSAPIDKILKLQSFPEIYEFCETICIKVGLSRGGAAAGLSEDLTAALVLATSLAMTSLGVLISVLVLKAVHVMGSCFK